MSSIPTNTELNDQRFIKEIEDLSLDPIHFDHRGHLRLCWLYLTQYDLPTASARVADGIRRYATHLGATDKFHATLTEGFVLLVASRMDASETDWQQFLDNNPDLLEDAPALLARHYSEERLGCAEAHTQVLPPDLLAF